MAQSYTIDVYDSTHTAATDLQNIENNFAALKSSHSGAATPSNTEAGMLWADTDSGASNELVLKVRDDGDATWFGLMHADSSHIILVYRNTALDGWAIDSSAGNSAVAVRGGVTYTTGGATAGSWVISGLTNAAAATHTHSINTALTGAAQGYILAGPQDDPPIAGATAREPEHNHGGATGSGGDHNHAISSNASWRIKAAVFTMQYLDM
jgi:hypothetical protein